MSLAEEDPPSSAKVDTVWTKVVVAVFAIFLYLVVWPSLELLLILSVVPSGFLKSAEGVLAGVPNELVSLSVILVYGFFAIAFVVARRSSPKSYWRLLFTSYCYAFVLAPGAIGGEGFGLPAPFPLAVIPGLASPTTMQVSLALFPWAWLIAVVVALGAFLWRRFIEQGTQE